MTRFCACVALASIMTAGCGSPDPAVTAIVGGTAVVRQGRTIPDAVIVVRGARLLRIDDRLGTLEPGKVADVIAVKGNPLDEIKAMRDVVFVMKDGDVFRQP